MPGAAEKWEYNADATELTFTLKPDLKYSDGTPLNAKRFEYSLIRNIDPETAGEYASITDEIIGAPEWRAADVAAEDYDRQKFIDALGVKALDASGQPCKRLRAGGLLDPEADAVQARAVLPHHRRHLGGLSRPRKSSSPKAARTGGTAPSTRSATARSSWTWWSRSCASTLCRTPTTAGDKPTYDLEYRYITDSAVAFEAYKNNELDIVTSAAEDFDAIKADPDLTAQHLIYPGCVHHAHQVWSGRRVHRSERQEV